MFSTDTGAIISASAISHCRLFIVRPDAKTETLQEQKARTLTLMSLLNNWHMISSDLELPPFASAKRSGSINKSEYLGFHA